MQKFVTLFLFLAKLNKNLFISFATKKFCDIIPTICRRVADTAVLGHCRLSQVSENQKNKEDGGHLCHAG